jgi:hypothetical protein
MTCVPVSNGLTSYGHFFLRNTTSSPVELVSITPVGVRRVRVRGILLHAAHGDLVGTAKGFPPNPWSELASPGGWVLAPASGTRPSAADVQVVVGLEPEPGATSGGLSGFRVVFTTNGQTYQMVSPQAFKFQPECFHASPTP